jgi:hypothetical protein
VLGYGTGWRKLRRIAELAVAKNDLTKSVALNHDNTPSTDKKSIVRACGGAWFGAAHTWRMPMCDIGNVSDSTVINGRTGANLKGQT